MMHTLRLTMIGLVLLSVFVFVAAQINQRKNKRTVDGARIDNESGDYRLITQDASGESIKFYITNAGSVGVGTVSPGYLLHVNGTAGKPGGGSWSNSSDGRLKKDVQGLHGILEKLLQLHGVSFEYKDPRAISELPGTQIGMIAQEVEQVFPQWVDEGKDGYKRITYRGFEALAVEALRQLRDEKDAQLTNLHQTLKQQQSQIETLKAEMERLSDKLRLADLLQVSR